MASTVAGRPDGAPVPGERRGLERSNNFTLIRVIAAAVVILDHSYRLAGQAPPLTARLGYTDVGTLAVYTFFIMSGHLLLSSWKANPRWFLFFFKRFMRIMPGLLFALLFGALLIGPLITTTPLADYFHSARTHDYVTQNLILFRADYDLPGVFGPGHNPFPAVNGSIWTLCYEVTLYCLVPLLGLLLLRSRRIAGTVVLLAAAALPWDRLGTMIPVTQLVVVYMEIFTRYFIVGAVLYAHRDRIPMRWFVALGLLALLVASLGHGWAPWVSYAVLPYEIVYLARLRVPIVAGAFKRRDPSYGMYVLAFPIQQSVISRAGGHIDPLLLFAVSLPLTVCCALFSWEFIEAPAMRMRGVLSSRLRTVRIGGLAMPAGALSRRMLVTASAGAMAGILAAVGAAGLQHGAAPTQVVSASAATVARPAILTQPPLTAVAPVRVAAPAPATAPTPPPTPRPRPVLIYLHGLGESPLHPALADLLNAATADGYQVIFTDEGGPETWGNRAAVDAIAALKARYSPDRPITLIGCSMGTLALLNYVASAPAGSVSAAVGILPYSHLPNEHQDSIRASGASEPAQTISVPYQMWYGTNDTHAGVPTTSGPHVSLVPMPGAGHSLPIPYNIAALLHFLDGFAPR
jgi:peptidoglycan/LPS O-acetylase OafA/YrhL